MVIDNNYYNIKLPKNINNIYLIKYINIYISNYYTVYIIYIDLMIL